MTYFLTLLLSLSAGAQDARAIEPPNRVPFGDERWQIDAAEYELTEYRGKPALMLRGGSATLPDTQLKNVLIEFEMAVTESRGFAGAVFRLQDANNYEHFYIRPHQSGNPDANQYTPVFNAASAWQLYHGEHFSAPLSYPYGEWMSVKLIVAGDRAEVYLDSDQPVLRINRLRRDVAAGALGLNVANYAAAHFADFRFTRLSEVYEFPWVAEAEPPTEGAVMAWEVSSSFEEARVAGAELDPSWLESLTWQTVSAESSGLVNLATTTPVGDTRNTVLACAQVTAPAQVDQRELEFGYSDRAVVFINGRRAYAGDNTYRSRDYRYLGTIGYFDRVPLTTGAAGNRVCVAVSESFGGWGVMARLR